MPESKPDNVAAFSNAEIEEISEEIGLANIAGDNDSESATGNNEDTPRANNDSPDAEDEGAEQIADVVSLAEREKAAKDMFYKALSGGLNFANDRMTKKQPLGKYESLKLDKYGELSRTATDQFFDRLCEVPFIKTMLFKVNDNVIVEKWGSVILLSYTMYSGLKQEQEVRLKELNASIKKDAEKNHKENTEETA